MPERGFDDGFWSNPFTMKLPKDAKTLLAYLFTNTHCNRAGLYKIAPETIAFETGIPVEDIPSLFDCIKEKVQWYPEENLVWVKNFIKRQGKSPKFLVAAGRDLENIKRKDVVKELIDYNLKTHSISIPYGNSSSSIPIPASSSSTTSSKSSSKSEEKGESEGGEDKGLAKMRKVYEDNIGRAHPIIIEQLKELRMNYPQEWLMAAVGEACLSGKGNLKYIKAILERWQKEGFRSPKKGRGILPTKDVQKARERDGLCALCGEAGHNKYTCPKSKYGHLVR